MHITKQRLSEGITTFAEQTQRVSVRITTALLTLAMLAVPIMPRVTTYAQGGNAGGGTVAGTGADLQMSGSASTNSPSAGSVYTYTYKIKNSGPLAATGATFSDPNPSNVNPNYATVDGSTLPCVNMGTLEGGSTVQCDLGTIAKGGQATVVVSVTAPQVAATITNTATVYSDTVDPALGNNTVTINSAVKAPTGGVCKGGVCDTVPTAVAAPCAILTNVSAPVGYYLNFAAIWNTFTVQSCSTASEVVTVQVQETNIATGSVDYDVTYPMSLVPAQNAGLVLDNDFAPFSTSYSISYTLRDASGNVLSSASVAATTPPAR